MSDGPRLPNRELLLPYALPYLLYVAAAQFEGVLGREGSYLARIALCGLALVWARSRLSSLRGPLSARASAAVGLTAGLAGTALWVALLGPFVEPGACAWSGSEFACACWPPPGSCPLPRSCLRDSSSRVSPS